MSIRAKLLFLVVGTICVFLTVAVFAVISYLPISRISHEATILRKLSESTLLLMSDINGLSANNMNTQYKKIKGSKLSFDKSFEDIGKLKYLPVMDENTKKALETISSLQVLFIDKWNELEKNTDRILEDAEKELNSKNVELRSFWTSPLIRNNERFGRLTSHANNLLYSINIAVENLSAAYGIMYKQFDKIDKEIKRRESEIVLMVTIAIAVVFLFVFIISILVTKRINISIQMLENGLISVQKGDLTTVFEIKTKDEVGKLGQGMNTFTRELAESIQHIKLSSGHNIEIKESLQATTVQTSAAAHQISVNASSITNKIEGLDKNVQVSTKEVEAVKTGILDLNNMIQEQISMVEESTASVTEMLASISSVNNIAARKSEATKVLVTAAREGDAKLTQTTKIIHEITLNIDEIKGIATVIQDVAAQTSLLSMNAAIEAAHAGKYGMGFSVVADEIRKLADTSGKNSTKISQVVKEVIGKIESASVSGYETKKVFENINKEVKDVSSSFDEITVSMDELNTGSRQILQTMTRLQDYSTQVQESSIGMNKSTENLENSINIVERVSQEVLGGISEVSIGITEISAATNSLTEMSNQLNDIAENLNSEINRFQTDNDNLSDSENEHHGSEK